MGKWIALILPVALILSSPGEEANDPNGE